MKRFRFQSKTIGMRRATDRKMQEEQSKKQPKSIQKSIKPMKRIRFQSKTICMRRATDQNMQENQSKNNPKAFKNQSKTNQTNQTNQFTKQFSK